MNGAHVVTLETQISRLIVETLVLEDVNPDAIVPDEPLFGDGLGLDSIDALELAIALDRTFGVRLEAKDERNREILRSVRSIAAHVSEHRTR